MGYHHFIHTSTLALLALQPLPQSTTEQSLQQDSLHNKPILGELFEAKKADNKARNVEFSYQLEGLELEVELKFTWAL